MQRVPSSWVGGSSRVDNSRSAAAPSPSCSRWAGAHPVAAPACALEPVRSRVVRPLRASAPSTTAADHSTSALASAQDNGGMAVARFPAAAPGQFTDHNSAFFEDFPVRGYEVSPNQKASMVTIANLLQELAANHAVGMWGRAEKGFAGMPNAPHIIFVMTRLQIRMWQYPKWGDILRFRTYFTDEGRLTARRDWVVTDAASGQQLGAATSSWVNINMETRRLTKLPDNLKSHFMRFSVPQSQVAIPVEETKKKLPDIEEQLQGPAHAEKLTSKHDSADYVTEGPAQIARRSDMDMNGHINNVVYLAWALESVPQDVYDNYSLYEMEVDFKAECKAGDLVQSRVSPLPGSNHDGGELCFLHSLRRCDESGCTELVRSRTTWRKAQGAL